MVVEDLLYSIRKQECLSHEEEVVVLEVVVKVERVEELDLLEKMAQEEVQEQVELQSQQEIYLLVGKLEAVPLGEHYLLVL